MPEEQEKAPEFALEAAADRAIEACDGNLKTFPWGAMR